LACFFASWRLFRKKSPRVTRTARNRKPPMTVPAMTPMGVSDLDEVSVGVWAGVDVDVPDGRELVEEGEDAPRHELSSELPTNLTSELPPCLPRESNIKKTMDVSRATFAVHEYSSESAGGLITTEVPPGMMPTIVTGWIALE